MPSKKKKFCYFCREKIEEIDYKDIGRIRRFLSGRGKILSAQYTGNCNKHQRMLAKAIKRARFIGFLPFIQR